MHTFRISVCYLHDHFWGSPKSLAREVVASIPAIGLDAEIGADSALTSLAGLAAVITALGIGLGSTAGLASLCVDIAAAVSAAGVGEATTTGRWSQSRS